MAPNTDREWDVRPIIDWLLKDGRKLPGLEDIIFELGERLEIAQAPIERLRLSMRTLHPLNTAYSAIWERGVNKAQALQAPHGMENRPGYVGSPLEIIGRTLKPYRRNLSAGLSDEDHSVLHEFKERGSTDYYGVPLSFRHNLGGILAVLSDAEGGFTELDIQQIDQLSAALAPIGELFNALNTAESVADSYLGTRSGKLVLQGQITRGHVEPIRAATLISDIRNWTGLSNQLPPDQALDVVNGYFELLSEAIESKGGEILKFIGDGILAVFPVTEEHSEQLACRNALAASKLSLENSASVDVLKDIEFGIGLDVGFVLYGNIGSQTRLDFTVLGPTVNRTARIEGCCSQLGEKLLFSQEFANQLDVPVKSLGRHDFKGFEGEYEVFGLATEG